MNNIFNIKLPNGKTLQQISDEMKEKAQVVVKKTVSSCKSCGSKR